MLADTGDKNVFVGELDKETPHFGSYGRARCLHMLCSTLDPRSCTRAAFSQGGWNEANGHAAAGCGRELP